MEFEHHISESAFLVNESRARNVELSRDRYAHLWVTDSTRRLWRDFSREVYALDAVELALRNRFFLEHLEKQIRRTPDTVFVNLGAGFTSYPFLVATPCRCIEIDYEHVCLFKGKRIIEWQKEGVLPKRKVEFIPADFRDRSDQKRVRHKLAGALSGKPSMATLEGITYYLERATLCRLFEILSDVQTPGSTIALDFWTPDVVTNPVHIRFTEFFAKKFGHARSDYNLFDVDFLRSVDGYEVISVLGIQELEKMYSGTNYLADIDQILPEHYAVLERTG
ncbi:MAG: class I SAM-dependent methyltransferase [Candidatus Latescibacterota bacterium]|nr:MAG: class I SAM-dependent methyltransferase [Candidatus Latescibacterota bacterium]